MSKSRIDVSHAKHKIKASSSDKCAEMCLSNSLGIEGFKCLSFDVCKDPNAEADTIDDRICSFYNASFISDPSVVLDSQPECDHYASRLLRFSISYFQGKIYLIL